MKKISKLAALFTAFVAPLVAAAQASGYSGINVSAITPYSSGITGVINGILVPVLMAIAFIVFLYGVYKYFIQGAADEKSRTDGRQFTLWGIIGFVIILSLWGIVNLFMGTLGLSVGSAPAFPTIGTGNYTPTGNLVGSISQSSLQQQYASLNNNCPPGSAQAATASCQSQLAAYNQNLNAYNGSNGFTCGSVVCASGYNCDTTTQTCVANAAANTGASCSGNGISGTCEAVCYGSYDTTSSCTGGTVCCDSSSSQPTTNIPEGDSCTASPDGCASGLYCVPGDYGSVCSSSSSGGSVTPSPYQQCMDNNAGSSNAQATCDCQVSGYCPSAGTPQGGACTSTAECASGLTCTDIYSDTATFTCE